MCGIFFYCGRCPENNETKIAEMRAAFRAMRHRGPDDEQFHVQHGPTSIVMGFHRLAINGTAVSAAQPFVGQTVRAVCNGELWNYRALARQLKYALREGASDCEVILPLYEKYCKTHEGLAELFQKLDGVFATVLYDDVRRRVCIARDPIGIRSLYYARSPDGGLYVASALKGLPADALDAKQFPPGHFALFNTETTHLSLHRFSERLQMPAPKIIAADPIPSTEPREAFDPSCLVESLTDAVRKRLMSDRPIGCILSGGLDSTLITALVVKLRTQSTPANTYTIGLEGAEDFVFARRAAHFLGTAHHEFVVTEAEFLAAIPETIRQVESYDVTTVRASVGNYLLCQKIKALGKDVVLFCGDVADELFGGYRGFGLTSDPTAFWKENVAMLENVHFFDVLRCEKSMACNSLEARVPFADLDFVRLAMGIPPSLKIFCDGGVEKQILRQAFQGFLPPDLLWRRKEAFSDGVSKQTRSWYKIIQEHVATIAEAEPMAVYAINPPYDAESLYYRRLFDEFYPGRADTIPFYWKHPFSGESDPSARKLINYT